jgi:hypothetical protein
MTDVPGWVRAATYKRDSWRCVCCGSNYMITIQHREAVGMGGAGRKRDDVTPADLVTACLPCNERFESDLQRKALDLGWKIRRFRGGVPASEIPYYESWSGLWWMPDTDGARRPVSEAFVALTTSDP